ncbi:MAG: glycosyltransferase [Planctomycetes bacterium]|nr:glycosyltransferase [Planctomycetota bacterium]
MTTTASTKDKTMDTSRTRDADDQGASPRPMVTVVTPVFNGERCLQRCIASVAAQDYPNIEHVIVDGCSKDGTRAVFERAAAGRENLHFFSEPDAGVYDAMSKGVRMARGEYIHILNADDRYAANNVLSTTIANMERNRLDLCHARARQVTGDNETVCEFGRDVDFETLLKKMRVAHPTVVVRRSVYERFGTFSIGFRIAADHEFLLRVWNRISVGFIPDLHVLMEIGGVSTQNANVRSAYHESMAAAVIHGRNPFAAALRCSYEIFKHRIIRSRGFQIHDTKTDHRPLLVPVGEPLR